MVEELRREVNLVRREVDVMKDRQSRLERDFETQTKDTKRAIQEGFTSCQKYQEARVPDIVAATLKADRAEEKREGRSDLGGSNGTILALVGVITVLGNLLADVLIKVVLPLIRAKVGA